MGKCLSHCVDSNSTESQRSQQSHNGKHRTPTPPSYYSSVQKGQSVRSAPSDGSHEEYYTNGSSHKEMRTSEKKAPMHPAKLPTISSIQRTSNNNLKTISISPPEYSETRIRKLFDKYKDEHEDCILAEGVERFCQDLGVDPAEFIVLALAWKFNAGTMCKFTREEFEGGCRALKVDSIKGIQASFPSLLQEVKDETTFKDLYRWTFQFGLDSDQGQRSLPIDMALPLWHLVFSHRQPPLLHRWFEFLKDSQVRGISRDTWNMYLNFVEVVGEDLSTYDDTEAWPSLFDDFVDHEHQREKQAKERGMQEDEV
ncbi:DCN1-like protein 3 [Branchiostoma floridae]|uniref:Defective in cullin neddylation protein n=1 Tax=Branchiostoma floridae TaxID=7739 RepID=A0A9J7M6H9_BRAFL|nr:DCN1-like protein 3 [Branchiostoma floridae]XP_035695077.1 DCN1-like protein 3 [Branchiostoma floridae]XP_035695078.1 DCN1-like protein 3 [Branchiostoma floridae]